MGDNPTLTMYYFGQIHQYSTILYVSYVAGKTKVWAKRVLHKHKVLAITRKSVISCTSHMLREHTDQQTNVNKKHMAITPVHSFASRTPTSPA